jgi:hypothetical protein
MLHGSAIAFNSDKSAQLIVGMDGAGFYAADLGVWIPYEGIGALLPGAIESTNYDLGGEGIAFHHAANDARVVDGDR